MKKRNPHASLQRDVDKRVRGAVARWIASGRHFDEYSSLEDVARELDVAQEQLTYFFTSTVRKPFKTWRKELRIEEAKLLLAEYPDMPASTVGALVGIPDKSNFRRQFREQTGCSPSEWRAACRKNG